MEYLKEYIGPIKHLCDTYRVKALFAFGSVTRNTMHPGSDLDFVVDIDAQDPLTYADSYFALKFQLELLFKRHIDLLEEKSIRNPYLKQEIDQTKVLVYGK